MSPRDVESLGQSLVRRVARTERELKALQNKNDLGYSSIEDSGAINEYAGNGTLQASFGGQYDGSNMAASFTGPTPPEPTAPICTGGITAVIRWDGHFAANFMTVAPLDFSRVEIHASQDPNFEATMATTLRDAFESPRGGEKTISLPPGTWYVRLVARSIPGKSSPQSAVTEVTVTEPATDADLVAAEARFDADMLALSDAQADLDTGLELAEGRIFSSEQQLTGAVELPDLFARKVAAQSGQYLELDVKQLNVTDTALIKTGVAESFFTKFFATNRLSANQVYIGPGSNAIVDPYFEDPVVKANRQAISELGGTWSWDPTLNLAWFGGPGQITVAPKWFYFNPVEGGLTNKEGYIPVRAGDRWKFRVKTKTDLGGARIVAQVIFKDGSVGVNPANWSNQAYSAADYAVVDLESIYTVPDGVAYIMPVVEFHQTATDCYVFAGADFRSMLDSTLFVEGAINGQIVTGAVFQTHASPTQGIKFIGDGTKHGLVDNDAIVAFGPTGIKTVHLDGINNLLTGQLATNAPGEPGIILVPKTTTGQPGIWFSSDGATGGDEAAIYVSPTTWDLNLRGKRTAGGTIPNGINVHGGFSIMSGGVNHNNGSWAIGDTGIGFFYQVRADGAILGRGTYGDRFVQVARNFAGVYFRTSNGDNPQSTDAAIYVADQNSFLELRGPVANTNGIRQGIRVFNYLDYFDPPTSTFTANVGISSSPKDRLYKLTSASKYKLAQEEQTLEKALKLLQIVPKTWFDKFQSEAYADYLVGAPGAELDDVPVLRRIPGVVAEDVLEAGLEEYVTFDADGNVEGVAYDRLWTLLILLVKEIWNRQETMQGDLDKLKRKAKI